MELHHANRLAFLPLDDELLRDCGATLDDTEGLVNLPLGARECVAVALFKRQAARFSRQPAVEGRRGRPRRRRRAGTAAATERRGLHRHGRPRRARDARSRTRSARAIESRRIAETWIRATRVTGFRVHGNTRVSAWTAFFSSTSPPARRRTTSSRGCGARRGERSIGHTGTLDPLATGLLPLVLGRATRLASLLSGGDKTYDATIRLGVATDTDDARRTAARRRCRSRARSDDGDRRTRSTAFRGHVRAGAAAPLGEEIGGRKRVRPRAARRAGRR